MVRDIHPGEVWSVDFGLAAKVRPALLFSFLGEDLGRGVREHRF